MAVPQNSTFKFTDSGVTPFVVKPFTANGPQTPASSVLYSNPDGVGAVSANTSLVLVGRGTPYYGEVVQANMVYLLEHFSNKSRPMFPVMGQVWYKKQNYTDPNFPSDPTLKGLYLWSGTSWDPIQMKGTASSAELDMGGFRVTNIGDPSLGQDAINLRTGDTRYVRASGSDMDGTFLLLSGAFHVDNGARLSCDELPTQPPHVVNLAYLDLVSNALTADINSVDQRIDNIITAGGAFAPTTGATFTGNVILTASATLIAASGGSDFVMGGRRISNINVVPVAPDDVASKQYVDNNITTVNASIATTNSSIVDLQTETANFYAAKTGATFTGSVAIGIGGDFTLSGSTALATFGGRRISNIGTPTQTTDAATKDYVDQAVASRKIRRYVYTQSGSAAGVTLPGTMRFLVGMNQLNVYHQGLKMIANTQGKAAVTFTGTSLGVNANTGLAASTAYSVDVTLNGAAPVTLTITTGTGTTTFGQLVTLLKTAAVAATLAVDVILEAYSTEEIQIVFTSSTSGTSSTVALSYAVGSLFKVITTSATPVSTSGAVYDYQETGLYGTGSFAITFTTPPTNGDVLEFILA